MLSMLIVAVYREGKGCRHGEAITAEILTFRETGVTQWHNRRVTGFVRVDGGNAGSGGDWKDGE